jgi:hypothetical protein
MFRNQLRSKVNGSLDISKIPDGSVKMALRIQIKDSSDAFNNFMTHASNAYTRILDTGASWNAIYDSKLCVCDSVKKLEKPIVLDGIAGGLNIEESGLIAIDTMTTDGSIHCFEATVMLNQELPGILLCPQARLKNSKSMVQNPHDHFRVYHNRMEWHNSINKILDIPYDSSFLLALHSLRKDRRTYP